MRISFTELFEPSLVTPEKLQGVGDLTFFFIIAWYRNLIYSTLDHGRAL